MTKEELHKRLEECVYGCLSEPFPENFIEVVIDVMKDGINDSARTE